MFMTGFTCKCCRSCDSYSQTAEVRLFDEKLQEKEDFFDYNSNSEAYDAELLGALNTEITWGNGLLTYDPSSDFGSAVISRCAFVDTSRNFTITIELDIDQLGDGTDPQSNQGVPLRAILWVLDSERGLPDIPGLANRQISAWHRLEYSLFPGGPVTPETQELVEGASRGFTPSTITQDMTNAYGHENLAMVLIVSHVDGEFTATFKINGDTIFDSLACDNFYLSGSRFSYGFLLVPRGQVAIATRYKWQVAYDE